MTIDESHFIKEMYMEMYDLLLSYAISSLSNRSLAEEAVQEAFRIACLKSADFYNSPNPKGWIILVLKNTIRNIRRSQDHANALLQKYIAAKSGRETYSEDELSLDVAYKNIAHLEEFQLLKEMAVDGCSHLEMAEKRGISVDACKKRVERAKKLLKRKI